MSAAPHIRRATPDDTDTVVRILIAAKEASFPDTIDEHDRDVTFWTRRWRGYLKHGSGARQSRGDGWVFLAEVEGQPIGYVAYHHTSRHGTEAELQNIYILKEWQRRGIGAHLLGTVAASPARRRVAHHVRGLRCRQSVQALLFQVRRRRDASPAARGRPGPTSARSPIVCRDRRKR